MPKRNVVIVDHAAAVAAIKKVFRNNTVFGEQMGRPTQWVTNWKYGKNLPSPEEAAKMCELLSVQPEEIIPDPADAEKVRALMGEDSNAPEISDSRKRAHAYVDSLSEERLQDFIDFLNSSERFFVKNEKE